MKFFVGLFLAICVITLGIFLVTPSTQGQRERSHDGTYVKRGETTEKERRYSAEYKKLYPIYRGRKFSDLIRESNAIGKNTEELGASVGGYEGFFLPGAPVVTPSQFLAKLSCKSDVIVIGSPASKTSHMTEDETFIYTAYEFTLLDVLKGNPNLVLREKSVIDVTRPGGLIELDSRLIRIRDLSYEPLEVGSNYVLFLRYVKEVDGFLPAGPEGDFRIENDIYTKLSTRPLPTEIERANDLKDLLTKLQTAISRGCKEEENK